MPAKAKPKLPARKVVEDRDDSPIPLVPEPIEWPEQSWRDDWSGSVESLIRAYLASHSVEVECPACYGRANTFARDGADAPRICPTCHGKKTITILNLGA